MTDQQQRIVEYLRRHGKRSAKEIVDDLDASDSGVRKALAILHRMGAIRMAGAEPNEKKGRSQITVWEVVK